MIDRSMKVQQAFERLKCRRLPREIPQFTPIYGVSAAHSKVTQKSTLNEMLLCLAAVQHQSAGISWQNRVFKTF